MALIELPRELLHEIARDLDHVSFFNLCCVLEESHKSSRVITVPRLRHVARLVMNIQVVTSNAEFLLDQSKTAERRESRLLEEFELLLATIRGLERCYDNVIHSIVEDETVFDNELQLNLFLKWHSSTFDTHALAERVRLMHTHDSINCGVCIASEGIRPARLSHGWESGGWAVVREDETGTLRFIDTVQSPVLTPQNYFSYNDEGHTGTYHVLWPYSVILTTTRFRRMPVILMSVLRELIDHNYYIQATALLDD